MLAFVNVHNLTKTARETVAAFQRITSAEPAPEFSPVLHVREDIAAAFNIPAVAGLNVIEPMTEPEPAPVPRKRSAAVTVDRRRFLSDCRAAKQHIGRLPFANVGAVLRIENGSATLSANNLDALFVQTVDCEDSDRCNAAAFVPVEKLATLLAKLTAQTIGIHVENSDNEDGAGSVVRIVSGSSDFTIPTLAFDAIGETAETNRNRFGYFETPFRATFGTQTTAGELRNALERTIFATDSENGRFALSGIQIVPEPDRLTFAATDSRRLAIRYTPAETCGEYPREFDELQNDIGPADSSRYSWILPAVHASRVIDALKRVPDPAPVVIAGDYSPGSAEHCVIECPGRFTIRTKTVAGRFPRYQDVYPKSYSIEFTTDRKKLVDAIKTAAVVCSDENNRIDFRFRPDGSAELSAGDDENGRSRVAVVFSSRGTFTAFSAESCEYLERVANSASESAKSKNAALAELRNMTGKNPSVLITFDPRYLLDSLNNSSADSITFKLLGADRAAVIVDTGNDSGLDVVMPLAFER